MTIPNEWLIAGPWIISAILAVWCIRQHKRVSSLEQDVGRAQIVTAILCLHANLTPDMVADRAERLRKSGERRAA